MINIHNVEYIIVHGSKNGLLYDLFLLQSKSNHTIDIHNDVYILQTVIYNHYNKTKVWLYIE